LEYLSVVSAEERNKRLFKISKFKAGKSPRIRNKSTLTKLEKLSKSLHSSNKEILTSKNDIPKIVVNREVMITSYNKLMKKINNVSSKKINQDMRSLEETPKVCSVTSYFNTLSGERKQREVGQLEELTLMLASRDFPVFIPKTLESSEPASKPNDRFQETSSIEKFIISSKQKNKLCSERKDILSSIDWIKQLKLQLGSEEKFSSKSEYLTQWLSLIAFIFSEIVESEKRWCKTKANAIMSAYLEVSSFFKSWESFQTSNMDQVKKCYEAVISELRKSTIKERQQLETQVQELKQALMKETERSSELEKATTFLKSKGMNNFFAIRRLRMELSHAEEMYRSSEEEKNALFRTIHSLDEDIKNSDFLNRPIETLRAKLREIERLKTIYISERRLLEKHAQETQKAAESKRKTGNQELLVEVDDEFGNYAGVMTNDASMQTQTLNFPKNRSIQTDNINKRVTILDKCHKLSQTEPPRDEINEVKEERYEDEFSLGENSDSIEENLQYIPNSQDGEESFMSESSQKTETKAKFNSNSSIRKMITENEDSLRFPSKSKETESPPLRMHNSTTFDFRIIENENERLLKRKKEIEHSLYGYRELIEKYNNANQELEEIEKKLSFSPNARKTTFKRSPTYAAQRSLLVKKPAYKAVSLVLGDYHDSLRKRTVKRQTEMIVQANETKNEILKNIAEGNISKIRESVLIREISLFKMISKVYLDYSQSLRKGKDIPSNFCLFLYRHLSYSTSSKIFLEKNYKMVGSILIVGIGGCCCILPSTICCSI